MMTFLSWEFCLWGTAETLHCSNCKAKTKLFIFYAADAALSINLFLFWMIFFLVLHGLMRCDVHSCAVYSPEHTRSRSLWAVLESWGPSQIGIRGHVIQPAFPWRLTVTRNLVTAHLASKACIHSCYYILQCATAISYKKNEQKINGLLALCVAPTT